MSSCAYHLHKLCSHLLGKSHDDPAVSSHFQSALRLLSSSATLHENSGIVSEMAVVEKIKKTLVRDSRTEDAAKISELYSRLQGCPVPKNKSSVLTFLLSLSEKSRIPRKIPSFKTSLVSESSNGSSSFAGKLKRNSVLQHHPPLPPKPNISRDSPGRTTSSTGEDSGDRKPRVEFSRDVDLVRELLFVFQGIEGKVLVRNFKEDTFQIASSCRAKYSPPIVHLVLRLSELGWLYNKLQKYFEAKSHQPEQGLVSQSFVSALKTELLEYYRLLSVLESHAANPESGLSLLQLNVWTLEPMNRLKVLAEIVDASQGLVGGGLISCIYTFLHHGDPAISETVRNVLCSVCAPIYKMLLSWICDGIIEDPFNEFFIAFDPKVHGDNLWHEKYSIRTSMIPGFLGLSWVKKILATGKSINFLHEVCHDSTSIVGRATVKKTLNNTSAENLFSDSYNNELHSTIQRAYSETSRHVLDIVFTRYKLIDHLSAIRKYLLLGQGDVIRYLLELLEEELCKPATSLYPHNLAGFLETAIRATNAQYEDPDVLNRLDVRLLEIQSGDTGWNVFSLDYKVAGPIGTVLKENIMTRYLMLFNALWRAKRMEWMLSCVWKRQASLQKLSHSVPKLAPVLHIFNLLSSEMIHFIHQMAYYITFEVMECSWDVLINQLHQAESLDEVIFAHEHFLDNLMKRVLLDERSTEILADLRAIYDRIIEFQTIQNNLYVAAVAEVEARRSVDQLIKQRERAGVYGLTEEGEAENVERETEFQEVTLPKLKNKLKICSQSYRDKVRTFLLQLACCQDTSLQCLSFRLDFNEHYKKEDLVISTKLTYKHRRVSNMGVMLE